MRIAIYDDGAGNVHSLEKALSARGDVAHVGDVAELCAADVAVLPGVGAFDAAMARLGDEASRLSDALSDGLACLAVCLGMQLLFDRSAEGELDGLGVLPGSVIPLRARRRPHIGWEVVANQRESTIDESGLVWGYYAHGYACPSNGIHSVTATSRIESEVIPATIRAHRILGTQFHPEKSSGPGVALIHAFLDEVSS